MMITITIDQTHIDEALETLAEHEPATHERAEGQAEAIEAICLAVRDHTARLERGEA